jgi:hypothetical protein
MQCSRPCKSDARTGSRMHTVHPYTCIWQMPIQTYSHTGYMRNTHTRRDTRTYHNCTEWHALHVEGSNRYIEGAAGKIKYRMRTHTAMQYPYNSIHRVPDAMSYRPAHAQPSTPPSNSTHTHTHTHTHKHKHTHPHPR